MPKKTFISLGLATSLLLGGIAPSFATNPVRLEQPAVFIDNLAVPSYIKDVGSQQIIMLPLRAAAEKLGYTVKWNNMLVELARGNQWTSLKIGENRYTYAKMAPFVLESAPELKEGQTYVPLNFMEKVLQGHIMVDGDGAAKTIKVVSQDGQQVNPVTIATKKVQQKTDLLEVDLDVPVLSGLSDQALQDKINQEFVTKSQAFQEQYTKLAAEYAKEAKENNIEFRPMVAQLTYEVPTNNDGLLSLNLIFYSYTGGAHGNTVMESLNYDLKTGKQLQMQDFFSTGANYQQIISDEISKQIKANQDMYFPEALEQVKGIANRPFYVEGGRLVVYFDLYDIAPYAGGIPKFAIPVQVLP